MRIALLADIHSNLEALEVCLAHVGTRGVDRIALLGDYVGYGADPGAVVDIVAGLAGKGATVIRGNHDEAVETPGSGMNPDADAAIRWTRDRLDDGQKAFLRGLPLSAAEGDVLLVHGDATAPERYRYVADAEAAQRSIGASAGRVTFCGHVHRPAIYGITATGKLVNFRPVPEVPVPLLRQRRWHVVLGSVGQPRDGDSAACYAIYDTAKAEVTFIRLPYDHQTTAGKIRRAGLPEALAARLAQGR